MKALAILFADSAQAEEGFDSLIRIHDAITATAFPATHQMCVFIHLLIERHEEGLPTLLHLEMLNSDGDAMTLSRGDFIAPVRKHPDTPSVWALKYDLPLGFEEAGLYLVRLTVGDECLAERPFLVSA